MEKHFVIFLSPGTLVAETDRREIDSWNIEKAVEMARTIKQRHGAVPYGFFFTTSGRDENELDSKLIKKSGVYYLGGIIKTIDEIRAENDQNNEILLSNMEINGWNRVVINTNSWQWTQPLKKDDVVLDVVFNNV